MVYVFKNMNGSYDNGTIQQDDEISSKKFEKVQLLLKVYGITTSQIGKMTVIIILLLKYAIVIPPTNTWKENYNLTQHFSFLNKTWPPLHQLQNPYIFFSWYRAMEIFGSSLSRIEGITELRLFSLMDMWSIFKLILSTDTSLLPRLNVMKRNRITLNFHYHTVESTKYKWELPIKCL